MTYLESVAAEYGRYRRLAEMAIAQVDDDHLQRTLGDDDQNSIAVIVCHVAGNLRSRFTDFLTSDGEKPWRGRDREFEHRAVSRKELLDDWRAGWTALDEALATLGPAELEREVTIRGQPLTVTEALNRSLSHAAYHVGQIVFLARSFAGRSWRPLSIPKGGSSAYNANPDRELERGTRVGTDTS